MESASEKDTTELIKRAQRGDKEAFGALYRSFQIRIYRFIYSFVSDRPMAEDLTQMTFLRVWKALPAFDTRRGTFTAYLFASARNTVIDWQRRKKEARLSAAEDVAQADDSVEAIDQQDRLGLLQTLIRGLSEEDRQLITLRYFEELSFSQIGEIFGKTEVSVRVKVHRILGELRKKAQERI